jgi:predicted dehydrogenase
VGKLKVKGCVVSNESIMLFGAGGMAVAYSRVLEAQKVSYEVFGRSSKSALEYTEETGHVARTVPFDKFYKGKLLPQKAIVAVSTDQLAALTQRLLESGVSDILVEKPGGISIDEVRKLCALAERYSAKVVIGFNRRFYASTLRAMQIIEEDGGATSCTFDFTEWLNAVHDNYADAVYKTWMLSNPIHVLDHFINFCGLPKSINSYAGGDDRWRDSDTIFVGAGISESNILFSYHANWGSAGRWHLEILTKKRKLIFCPMEKLAEIRKQTVVRLEVDIDDQLDLDFKPGIYLQTKAFLNGDYSNFCDIEQQLKNFDLYYKIANYRE